MELEADKSVGQFPAEIRNHILSLKEDLSDIQCHARLFIRSRNLFQFVHNGTICDMNIAIGIRFKQPDDYICCLIQILIGFIFCKFFDYNNVFSSTAVTKSFDFPPKSPRIFSSSFPSFSRFVSTKNTTRRTSVSI